MQAALVILPRCFLPFLHPIKYLWGFGSSIEFACCRPGLETTFLHPESQTDHTYSEILRMLRLLTHTLSLSLLSVKWWNYMMYTHVQANPTLTSKSMLSLLLYPSPHVISCRFMYKSIWAQSFFSLWASSAAFRMVNPISLRQFHFTHIEGLY